MVNQISVSDEVGVKVGVVPTHTKFVGGLVPDDNGNLPRVEKKTGSFGSRKRKLVILDEMERLKQMSQYKIDVVPVPFFPGMSEKDTDELMTGLQDLGFKPQLILMVGGADPMNPADEEKMVEMLRAGIQVAKKYGITDVASTSLEEWMQPGAQPKTGDDYDAAVKQLAKLHARVYVEEGLGDEDCCIESWHVEFLRGTEFQTFNDVKKGWEVVRAMNEELGLTDEEKKFFKVLIDAAHCGDSDLDVEVNKEMIHEIARSGEFDMFHYSAKTTRGHLATGDGWPDMLLAEAVKTGKLKHAFVEIFHHEDPALAGLREKVPGHGKDTVGPLKMTYSDAVIDGVKRMCDHILLLNARDKFGAGPDEK